MDVFEGVRVVEMASWQFVPAAAAVLGEFGADVVKVEPRGGDPQRAMAPPGDLSCPAGMSPSMHQTNRGKRSIALDPSGPEGQQVLGCLVDGADVFMTNLRSAQCQRLGITAEQLRRTRPSLIYARGTALGSLGPQAQRPGFDITAYWARGGVGHALTAPDAEATVGQRPGFGDKQGAMNLAFGIAAALVRRARTGEGAVVDASLLASALWTLSSDLVATRAVGVDRSGQPFGAPNPANGSFRTADGRWLRVQCQTAQPWWTELCHRLSRPELAADPRFADASAREDNAGACRAELARAIGEHDLAHWRRAFSGADFPWEAHQNLLEVLDDVQVEANDYVTQARTPAGDPVGLVRAPVRIDGRVKPLRPAPALGEHTDEILTQIGYAPEGIVALRRSGTVG
jgi:crotonobetainyl-CoA:carnitine CoA-transferase CaiB-like acyl-CoA transferase